MQTLTNTRNMLPVYKNIILTGFMGAGKTTVGRILAQSCGFEFMDIDQIIVASQGKSIKEIFAEEGEEVFRNYETEALVSLRNVSQSVIATGGGIILRSQNRQCLKQMGLVVYLRASFETLLKRVSQSDQRPLANFSKGTERLKALLDSRAGFYEQADIVADTDDLDSNQVTEYILARLKKVAGND